MAPNARTDGIPKSLARLAVAINELHPFAGNARRGDTQAIRASLEAHGQYRPIVARRGTGQVLAGNHTLAAARELGWTHLAATWVDVDDAQAARIVLVDNRTNDLAGYDAHALAALLSEVSSYDSGLAGSGFDDADLDQLIADIVGETEPSPGTDTSPEPPPRGSEDHAWRRLGPRPAPSGLRRQHRGDGARAGHGR